MINSMTGYGSAAGSSGKLLISIEIKSVNNRFLDCSVKLPRLYSFAEETVKGLVQQRIGRGKVDVFVSIDASADDDVVIRLNEPVLRAYQDAMKKMESDFGIRYDAGAVSFSRLPDVFIIEKKQVDAEAFKADLETVVNQALDVFCAMRAREGGRLAEDIRGKLSELEHYRQEVLRRSPETVREYREKLLQRMKEVLEGATVEESRVVTEAAIFADKVAVDEELVRLDSHIHQIRDLLTSGGSVGRKLDFLIQELNREVNTTGSKCVDLEITKIVVEMKALIEKIREQAQNIE